MNYLAHLFLSKGIPELMAGNMIEDFISGRIDHPRLQHIPASIKKGIQLHRLIDTFTDTNPIVKQSKSYFSPRYGLYASILVDVYFDHFLLKNWSKVADVEFIKFKKQVYEALPQFQMYYPEPLKRLVNSMIDYDWLGNYQYNWGLERAFMGLDSKIKKDVHLVNSLPIFEENYSQLNQEFLIFIEEIQHYLTDFYHAENQF